jgi:class 3 adenylate cyclase
VSDDPGSADRQASASAADARRQPITRLSDALQPLERPPLNRWQLVFEREVERQHHAFYESRFRKMLQILCLAMALVVAGASVYNWFRMGYGTARWAEAALVTLLMVGYLRARTPSRMESTRAAICALAVASIPILATLVELALPERRPFMVGVVYLALLMFQVLPLPFPVRAFVIVGTPGYYLWAAYRDGIYSGLAWLPIANQLAIGTALTLIIAYMLDRAMREQFLLTLDLEHERRRSDALLHNVLPAQIAARLKASRGGTVVDSHAEATVIFADIVGFTAMAAERAPAEVVGILNHLFSRFDVAAAQIGVEKIKTIGDSYMAVAGLPVAVEDSAGLAAELALEMREAVRKYSLLMGLDIKVRIGLHTGPVAAGIIGTSRFLYDLWGDTVNLASRLESTSLPGEIQVSKETKSRLEGRYRLGETRIIHAKGIGEVEAAILIGPVAPRATGGTEASSAPAA